ncbi:MAG: hypothetical protein ACFE8U_12340 [Candidatus Hermodarchaeota archaeon]
MYQKSFLTIGLIPFSIILLIIPLIGLSYLNAETNSVMSLALQHSPNKIAGQPFTLQTTHVLSQESNEESKNVKIVIDDFQNIHVVWQDNDPNYGVVSPNIFYKRYNPYFGFWSPPEIVSFGSVDYSYLPSLATDHLGNVHVTWTERDASGYDILYRRWTRASGSWSSIYNVTSPCNGYSHYSDIEIDNLGNIHVVWEDASGYNITGIDRDIFYRYLPFGSKFWSEIYEISRSTYECYGPQITIDNDNRPHVVWYENNNPAYGPNYQVVYRRVSSDPRIFDVIRVVSIGSECGSGDSADPQIAFDKVSDLHFSWHQYYGGIDYDILHRKFDIGNSQWSSVFNVSAGTSGYSTHPTLALDKSGNIHVAWEDEFDLNGTGTDYDIFYRFMDNVSLSWSDIMVISTAASDGDNDQMSALCEITVDTFGHTHFVWNDHENYLGSDVDSDIFYRKLAAPPLSPILNPILPNPSLGGVVNLTWNEGLGAFKYYIYRDTNTITSTSTLTPLAETQMSSFIDREIKNDGIYYYVVVGSNFVGNSSISNCEGVEVINCQAIPTNSGFSTTTDQEAIGFGYFVLILGVFSIIYVRTILRSKK